MRMPETPSFKTADLSDRLGETARIVDVPLHSFGGLRAFGGRVATVRAPEDNSLVRRALEEPGEGRVLLVEGGGSRRCALLGDLLGDLAVKNGWRGVVVNGCVRDSVELSRLPLGVLALGTCPKKSEKRGRGEREVVVHLGGTEVRPGEWLYADEDGVLITPGPA